MDTIGVELSDAGILAAGGEPCRVLEIDQRTIESPGYAVQLKKQLLLGRQALEQSRLHPRQVNNRFWSQLSTNPLSEKTAAAKNYAELAYAHLDHIRKCLPASVSEWVFAVPGFLDEAKLGILLGVTGELSVPIRGLVSSAVAAVRDTTPLQPLLHVDVHLHRVEITRLSQATHVTIEKTQVIPESGWHELFEQLAKGLANEFVKATRYDPLHDASTEQQLHDQLALLVRKGPGNEGMPVELNTGRTAYSLSVLPQMLTVPTSALREKIRDGVQLLANDADGEQGTMAIQLSHRAALVPGLRDELQTLANLDIEELPAGAGAMGALQLVGSFTRDHALRGTALYTSRDRRPEETSSESPADSASVLAPPVDVPTHLLYEDRAYPLEPQPLVIGTALAPEDSGILVSSQIGSVAARHCAIHQENGLPVLEVMGPHETLVDGTAASGRVALAMGQRIRMGDPPQEFRLIVAG